MLTKLAFRNAKRSMRDYLIYIITMTGIAALMYAFNSLIYCKELMEMCSQSFVFAIMLGFATFFIIIIMAWLINYMVHFMLEKRSREFGTYLLMGMKKTEVSALYMKENVFLGTGSFLLGLLLGALLQQILMTVFYSVFGSIYQITMNFSIWCFLLTFICYFISFVFALHKNKKVFKKMQIIQFMHMEEEKDVISKKRSAFNKLLFFISAGYLILFIYLVYRGNYQVFPAIAAIIGFFVAIYLFYVGGSAFLMGYIEKRPKSMYQHGKIFLLRQMSVKLKNMRFTFGTLTVLFTCALLGSSVAFMFSSYMNIALNSQMPFDVLIYSNNTEEKYEEELTAIQNNCGITDQYIYQIYQNGTNTMNDYLYSHNRSIGKKYKNQDGSLNREKIAKDGYEYYDYDTYMKLSDYNRLRDMLGLSQVTLNDDSYLIQTKDRIERDLQDYKNNNHGALSINGKELKLSAIVTDAFSMNGNNGADYLIIIPDRYVTTMQPFFSELAASLENKTTTGLMDQLQKIYRDKNGILSEQEFDQLQEEGKIDSKEVRKESLAGGCGTDQIINCTSDVMVSNELGRDMRFIITSIVFPLVYIGLVFICVAFTILAVQQLSDSTRYRYRYDVLRKLGMKEKELKRLVFRQLNLYYLLPVGMSVLISGIIACFAGIQFVKYTSVSMNGLSFYAIVFSMFVVVYLIYYAATYLGFCKNIHAH